MASPLRQKRSNAVVWALMGLLVLGIGGFGITSFTGNVQAIGAVGEREVDVNDYARTLQGEMRALSAELGEPVSFAQAQALGIDSAVQAQLFAGAALDHEADRLGVSLGDDELRKRLFGHSGVSTAPSTVTPTSCGRSSRASAKASSRRNCATKAPGRSCKVRWWGALRRLRPMSTRWPHGSARREISRWFACCRRTWRNPCRSRPKTRSRPTTTQTPNPSRHPKPGT